MSKLTNKNWKTFEESLKDVPNDTYLIVCYAEKGSE